MVEMALDPVCGMSIDQERAPVQAEWGDKMYHFCANGCREDFLKDPEKYVNAVTNEDYRT